MMPRPDFITVPGAWLRTPRTGQSRAELATPIVRSVDDEHRQMLERHARPAEALICILAGVVLGGTAVLALVARGMP